MYCCGRMRGSRVLTKGKPGIYCARLICLLCEADLLEVENPDPIMGWVTHGMALRVVVRDLMACSCISFSARTIPPRRGGMMEVLACISLVSYLV